MLLILIVLSCSKDKDELKTIISTSNFVKTVDENQANGTALGIVNGTSNNGSVTFNIISQKPNGALVINANTGELSVNDSKLFDYEVNPEITAEIEVKSNEVTEKVTATIVLNDLNYSTVSTFVGKYNDLGNLDGQGNSARFYNPWSIAINSNGILYICDYNNKKIRKITKEGVVSTIPNFTAACRAIAIDSNDNVFVATTTKIFKISPQGTVASWVGHDLSGYVDASGGAARFNQIYGLTIDDNDNLYVSDTNNKAIRKVNLLNATVTTLVQDNKFNQITGLKFNKKTNSLYAVTLVERKLLKITLSGNVSVFVDDTRIENGQNVINFVACYDFEIDSKGDFFLPDYSTNKIMKVTSDGKVSVFAGEGTRSNLDGNLLDAKFSSPIGITINKDKMYVVDHRGHVVREISE